VIFSVLMVSAANGQVLVDSVADFSGVQGHKGLFYGYYNKTLDGGASAVYDYTTDFMLMSTFAGSHSLQAFATAPAWVVDDRVGGVWTMLWANGGHPNGILTSGGRQSVEHFAVRRWVSTYTGLVIISGTLAKLDTSSGSNGTAFRLRKNSVNIANGGSVIDSTGLNYSVQTNVVAGDNLDLFLDSWAADDLGDSSKLTMRVEAVPEPASIFVLAGGLSMILGAKRRKVV
jgi:hypothetical protein